MDWGRTIEMPSRVAPKLKTNNPIFGGLWCWQTDSWQGNLHLVLWKPKGAPHVCLLISSKLPHSTLKDRLRRTQCHQNGPVRMNAGPNKLLTKKSPYGWKANVSDTYRSTHKYADRPDKEEYKATKIAKTWCSTNVPEIPPSFVCFRAVVLGV